MVNSTFEFVPQRRAIFRAIATLCAFVFIFTLGGGAHAWPRGRMWNFFQSQRAALMSQQSRIYKRTYDQECAKGNVQRLRVVSDRFFAAAAVSLLAMTAVLAANHDSRAGTPALAAGVLGGVFLSGGAITKGIEMGRRASADQKATAAMRERPHLRRPIDEQ